MRIESDFLKASEIKNKLKNVSGVLIPGGFGKEALKEKLQPLIMQGRIKFLF